MDRVALFLRLRVIDSSGLRWAVSSDSNKTNIKGAVALIWFFLNGLHYDNTSPTDSDGKELVYDNKKYALNSSQYQSQEETRKKQLLIKEIQDYWKSQKKPRIKAVAETFGIAQSIAKKYIFMTSEEIASMDHAARRNSN